MARDILREYGPESPQHQKPRASSGGITHARDVHNYQPPHGPKTIHDHGPGLHGAVHHCGTQGHYDQDHETSGSPGIAGTKHPKGSQR